MRKALSVMSVVAVSLFSAAGLVSCGDGDDDAENAVADAAKGGGGDDATEGNGSDGNGSDGNGNEGNGEESNKGTHETVDLGLPSGIRRATCNVCASAPYETGDYFAWGETKPKDCYEWSTYKWCYYSINKLTKYFNDPEYGLGYGWTDNKFVLGAEDDAATANWGAGHRMPTFAEFYELKNSCTRTWETNNGMYGYTVTGPNGNSIFLPASGYRDVYGFHDQGSRGYYWSATLRTDNAYHAYYLFFLSRYPNPYACKDRSYGLAVRPVAQP